MGTHPETPAGRARRTKAGTAFFIASLPLMACGGWLLFSAGEDLTFLFSGLGGLAVGLLALIGGLHGLTSKPQLNVDETGLTVRGFMLSGSNWSLPWSQLTNARLLGEGEFTMLHLTGQTQKTYAIERYRYEGFEELLAEVEKRLGRPVEKGPLVPPAKKS